MATVTCSCGNTFVTRSTESELRVEICSKCHPFYSGKQKLVDSGGRVQRFQRKYGLEVTEPGTPMGKEKGARGATEEAAASSAEVAEKPAGGGVEVTEEPASAKAEVAEEPAGGEAEVAEEPEERDSGDSGES